jgi:hypothetical protein
MPRGDGTGPMGQGPKTGQGKLGANRGMGQQTGPGRGRMGGEFAAGPSGNCVCTSCGNKIPHTAGQPCTQMQCPKCGAVMTRG